MKQLAALEIVGEDLAHIVARSTEDALAAVRLADRFELVVVFAKRVEIRLADVGRAGENLTIVFDPQEADVARKGEIYLVRVHHLEQNDLVPGIAESLNARDQVIGVGQEIA